MRRSTEELRRITVAILAIEGVVRTNTAISLVEVMPPRVSALLEVAASGSTPLDPEASTGASTNE
jgi:hypothetical protein